MFYMLIIGIFMIPFINNAHFLNAFNIHMESYYMALWLIYMFLKHSVHFILQLILKVY